MPNYRKGCRGRAARGEDVCGGRPGTAGPAGTDASTILQHAGQADVAAADAHTESPWTTPTRDTTATIAQIRLFPLGNVPADTSIKAVVTVGVRRSDGSGGALVPYDTEINPWVAYTPISFGVPSPPLVLAPGDYLTVTVTKPGVGVKLPGYVITAVEA